MFELLDDIEGKIRGGGHQLKVFSQLPTLHNKSIANLKKKDMRGIPLLPCTSICIRLVEQRATRPPYMSGYYQNFCLEPGKFEKKLISHYFKVRDLNDSMEAVCMELQRLHAKENHNTALKYTEELLRITDNCEDLNRKIFKINKIEDGILVKLLGLQNLPLHMEGLWIMAEVEIVGEFEQKDQYRFFNTSLDLSSFQKSPR